MVLDGHFDPVRTGLNGGLRRRAISLARLAPMPDLTSLTTPIGFLISVGVAGLMVFVMLRAALVPERRFTGWTRYVTGRNGKYAFGLLLVLWIAGMAVLAALGLPANIVGGPALIGLLVGFFIFMGFIWSVIGE